MSNRKKLGRVQKRKQKLAKKEKERKQNERRQSASTTAENLAFLANSLRKEIRAMWTQEKVEAMGTEAIIEKLDELGIDFDEANFRSTLQDFYSPSDVAEHLWDEELHSLRGLDDDFPRMAACVLWQRFCPEIANTQTIIQGIREGDDLLDHGEVGAACDRWLQVWNDLKSRFLRGTKTVDTVEDRVGDYYSINSWLVSIEMELGNAGLDNPEYVQKRIQFCTEVSELLPDSPTDFLERMGCGVAESHFMLGNAQMGEAAFEALTSKLPNVSWVLYATWGDLWRGRFRSKVPADLERASELYEQAAALASPGDLENINRRIEELPFNIKRQERSKAMSLDSPKTIEPIVAESGQMDHPQAIKWEFGPDIPTHDWFEGMDLSDPWGVGEAIESFIFWMEDKRFLTWEAVAAHEQGLPLTELQRRELDGLISFGDPDDDQILSINGIERPSESWDVILNRTVEHLLIEPFDTSEAVDEVSYEGWERLVACLAEHGEGLSLPPGITRPIDVIPKELQHKLWLQGCFCGLSEFDSEELPSTRDEEGDQMDGFIKDLRRCKDSVAYFDLTPVSLLDRVKFKEKDRQPFVRILCERLGMKSAQEKIAPRLQ